MSIYVAVSRTARLSKYTASGVRPSSAFTTAMICSSLWRLEGIGLLRETYNTLNVVSVVFGGRSVGPYFVSTNSEYPPKTRTVNGKLNFEKNNRGTFATAFLIDGCCLKRSMAAFV